MGKTAIVIGASGLIGNNLLQLLLNDPDFFKVKIFVRKALSINNEKLEQHIIDFNSIANYKELITGDVLFCCLGTTIKTAGSKEAFLKVDYTYPEQFAEIAAKNGVEHYLLISSIGADKNSSNFYLKVKGDIEHFLRQQHFKTLTILRPSLLLGDRNEFRLGELFAKFFMNLFPFVFIRKLKPYKPIEASTVAKAMLVLSKQISNKTGSLPSASVNIFLSDKLQVLGKP